MKFIDISDELLEMLEPYSNWFFKQDLTHLIEMSEKNPKNTGESIEYCCSEEYLDVIVTKDGRHEGYPEISYSCDIMENAGQIDSNFKKPQIELQTKLTQWLGARNEAVHVFYPVNGFMGWHNNWNAHGYNILLSYTENGGGFFRYRDPKTHEVIHLQDPGGWSCKVGYYGRGREPDKVYYHCAGTTEPRVTLGYVIPHLELWRDMCSDISGQDCYNFE